MGRGRCVVQGCSRKSTDKDNNPVKIYSIPRVRKYDEDITYRRRVLWLKRLNISDEEMPNGAGVCDAHFISGKPSYYIEESSPDWAPTQNIGSKNLVSKSALDRYNRRKKFQSMKAKKMDFLIKGNSITQVDLQPSTVSASRKIASLVQSSLSSKEVAKKDTNHQMPGVLKKTAEMIEIVNENQLDIFWMHKQPVNNSSQVCHGKVIELGETDDSDAVARLLNFNDPTPTLPVKRVACQNGGLGTRISQKNGESNRRPMVILPVENLASPLQQVTCPVHEEYSLFVSSSTTNDHDYCAKPTVQRHHIYMDHDYCQTLYSNELSLTAENISESSVVLFRAESPMQNPLELSDTESCDSVYEVAIYRKELPSSACRTDSMCNFILPDDAQCPTCAQVAFLRSELEQKSLVLEARSSDVNSLKRELELAKEQISTLRAQLEENTRTLWSCVSVKDQSS